MGREGPITQQLPRVDEELPLPVRLRVERLTPVFGTARPTRGLPSMLRAAGYRYPSHDARRWLFLLLGDRVESSGSLLREAVTPGRMPLVVRHFRRQFEAHPVKTLATAFAAALLVGAVLRAVVSDDAALGEDHASPERLGRPRRGGA